LPSLFDFSVTRKDQTRENQGLALGTTLDETTLDEQLIGTNATRHVGSRSLVGGDGLEPPTLSV
jgi:hypothetical protein